MALIAMCSAKGSPGVTVTALAYTLSWRRRTILAECDPAGGDIAAGYLRELRLDGLGLAQLTASLHRRRLAQDLWTQLVDLEPGEGSALRRLVLPGLANPQQATGWVERPTPGVPSGWEQLAQLFRSLETGVAGWTVIADCGRLAAGNPPTALLSAADAVLLVLRPTLPSMRAASVALAGLHASGVGPVALVVVGDRPYGLREVAANLGARVVAAMPEDPGTAAVLSTGGEARRAQLLRAAARAEAEVQKVIDAGRAARELQPAQPPAPAPVREVGNVH
jgi:hypothetical protein